MDNCKRKCLPNFSELIDCLTIDQIKEVLKPEDREVYAEEIQKLTQDLDIIISENNLKLAARLIRLIIVLAQINLHIWQAKDIMLNNPSRFEEMMKLAHQLNGIRNQIKNLMLEETGFNISHEKKTNICTDDLAGWQISL